MKIDLIGYPSFTSLDPGMKVSPRRNSYARRSSMNYKMCKCELFQFLKISPRNKCMDHGESVLPEKVKLIMLKFIGLIIFNTLAF